MSMLLLMDVMMSPRQDQCRSMDPECTGTAYRRSRTLFQVHCTKQKWSRNLIRGYTMRVGGEGGGVPE